MRRRYFIRATCLAALAAQLCRLKEQILEFDRMIIAWHRSHEASKRLDAPPRRPSARHGPDRQHR